MKRSEINEVLREIIALCRQYHFNLPSWGFWSPEEWLKAGHEYDEIRDCKLGWDLTDYGSGDFGKIGLALFTIRNGFPGGSSQYDKPYCEKLLVVKENQYTPYHFHFDKMEDIICRAGGNLMVKVYNSTPDTEELDKENPVPVNVDGHRYEVEPGATLRLTPGMSITLPSFNYHTFWAEEGHGTALVGEVSKVNDDEHDNRFLDNVARFPAIDEDEEPLHLLCNEYPPVLPGWMRKRLGW
jgi:D-lyxose ketol-isomerase